MFRELELLYNVHVKLNSLVSSSAEIALLSLFHKRLWDQSDGTQISGPAS